MWQPNRTQWSIIWLVAMVSVLAWPPASGPSLGVKIVNWAADPRGTLPELPPPLPMGMDDNGDAVTEHDAQLSAYYQAYESSSWTRRRMALKDAADPLEPSTARQLIVAFVVVGALAVWMLNGR